MWKRTDVRVGHQAELDDIARMRRAKRLSCACTIDDSKEDVLYDRIRYNRRTDPSGSTEGS